jgi:rSAM/selenodomain-associated transferase 1
MKLPPLQYPHACIALFARAPVAGQVKTRLIPALGPGGACALHTRLLRQMQDVLQRQRLCVVELWVDQLPGHAAFAAFGDAVHQQQGSDLGERLSHAAREVLQRHRQLVFIGTDCPALDASYLEAALAALATEADVVIGPALDGGYVLLGLKVPEPRLFAAIGWGGPEVLEQTLRQAVLCGLQTTLLPALADIDRPEDLALLPADWL